MSQNGQTEWDGCGGERVQRSMGECDPDRRAKMRPIASPQTIGTDRFSDGMIRNHRERFTAEV